MSGAERRSKGNPKRLALMGATGLAAAAAVAIVACQAAPQDQAGQGPKTLDAKQAANCQALVGKTLGGARIDSVETVAVGQKGGRNLFGSSKALVPFCRVSAVGSSGPGSSIKMQVLLPGTWNGKLVGVGGGGLSGGLSGSVGGLMRELARGYAGVANDAGHDDDDKAAWALGSPARVEDFGFRANHQAAVAAKAVAAAYYARPVERSYFSGCSNGGRDAMMLAQRFPEDYDGIVAGAPAINWTGLMASAQNNYLLYTRTPDAEKLPSKLEMVRKAVIAKCDKLDGVADDVLENPLACRFDPAELQCKPGQKGSACLTPGEVSVVRAIYRGPHTSDGQEVQPGYPPSSEHGKAIIPIVGWAPWFLNGFKAGVKLSTSYYRSLVTQNPDWDPQTFQLDRDYALAKAKTAATTDALDPDLSPFVRRGGKLIMFHGWEDPAIPALQSVHYFDAVKARLGPQTGQSIRLFMAPGMGHCSLGHGPDIIDTLPVIDRWVSTGQAPQTILATKTDGHLRQMMGGTDKTVRTRPLCSWPATAHYKGSGSTDEAANFTCQVAEGTRGG